MQVHVRSPFHNKKDTEIAAFTQAAFLFLPGQQASDLVHDIFQLD